jgi:uncharacterized protein YciI
MSPRLWIIGLLVLALLPAAAQEAPGPASESELSTFQLVFVVRNAEFEDGDGVSQALADHRVERVRTAGDLYLRNLVNDDVALVAGPLLDHDRIEQVAVLGVDTREDAEEVFRRSPAIETGRNLVEVYSWRAAEQILRKPKDPDATRIVLLGLFKRPADAPSFSESDLQLLQAGHLENMRRMATSGDLVIAGPVEDGGELRGILVFRTQDVGRIETLLDRDPSVRARRLTYELYRWRVPKGSWPPRQAK